MAAGTGMVHVHSRRPPEYDVAGRRSEPPGRHERPCVAPLLHLCEALHAALLGVGAAVDVKLPAAGHA